MILNPSYSRAGHFMRAVSATIFTLPAYRGKPDLVSPRYRAIAMIHGCFWHGHHCPLFKVPGTRKDFWQRKIARNRARDQEVACALRIAGWRLATVCECSLRGPGRMDFQALVECISKWLTTNAPQLQVRGNRQKQPVSCPCPKVSREYPDANRLAF